MSACPSRTSTPTSASPDPVDSLANRLRAILRADPNLAYILHVVADLDLSDAWVAAGCIRNAVWDHLHGRPPNPRTNDVDVIWYRPERSNPAEDEHLQALLFGLAPAVPWSVKNQARMHIRNGDAPYTSATEAMQFWPETATAVAVRQTTAGVLEIAAPFGLYDLFGLIIRPTPAFAGTKRAIIAQRIRDKGWQKQWPMLRVDPPIT